MAYHQLGLLYREVYSYSPAVDAFRQAAELDPFHCGPRESLVDTLVDASRYTEAIDEAKALIKVAPANTFARHILSIVYFQLGDIQNALNMTVEISNLDPFDCHNHLRRASLYQHRGEFKNALQSYDRALEHTENATPLHDDILEAIEGLDDEQTHVVLLLASEDRMFSIKLQKDLEFALSERGFSLSRGGFLRLRSVISEQNFADTFVSHPVQPSGSWYYN